MISVDAMSRKNIISCFDRTNFQFQFFFRLLWDLKRRPMEVTFENREKCQWSIANACEWDYEDK